MSKQSERAADRRRAKLQDIQRRVEDGSLTIRKMTAQERKLYRAKLVAGSRK